MPVKALSKVFRGVFTDMVRSQLPHLELPASVRHKNWLVYCKPTVQGPDRVLDYLARHVHRGAIANGRIISIDDGKVTFRYQRTKSPQSKIMTLSGHEFIRRFLQRRTPTRDYREAICVGEPGPWKVAGRLPYKLQELELGGMMHSDKSGLTAVLL